MQLGIKDAARLLEVSEKAIYRWIEEGKLPACWVNEQYRFNRAELLEWATTQKIQVSPDIYREVDDGLSTLGEALSAGGVHGAVQARDKAEALKTMVGLIRLPEDVDRGFLIEMLLAREARSSTGVGEGIALPHARNPVVLPVDKPMVGLCYLDPAVDFAAPDHQPVHALFMIVSVGVRGHLHLLSRLAYVLRDGSFKSLLRGRAAEGEVLSRIGAIEMALREGGR
ncbi:MAG TPA: PTS fructose transporter subunit IIA [Elusimicrobia bacterium]|nr:PTS fructose transporter subunit IIA [Elusimicrobiota bacterium]HBT60171.1 PTS fructose transporter subunit IIA [Elusimicrobiota bacterium]